MGNPAGYYITSYLNTYDTHTPMYIYCFHSLARTLHFLTMQLNLQFNSLCKKAHDETESLHGLSYRPQLKSVLYAK